MEKFGFVGAGKVGTALSKYLQLNGYTFTGFYSEADQSLELLVKDSDVILITTPDDVIESVCQLIADQHETLVGKTLLHCSGALSSSILTACLAKGAKIGSLHPLQAFTGSEEDVTNLSLTHFTLEAPKESYKLLEDFIGTLGNPHVWIDSDKKALYHSAAVVLSNYMVTLLNEAFKYMETLNIPEDLAFKMMAPLIQSTIGNVKTKGTIYGLTGPIVRGDLKVVQSHVKQIKQTQSKQSSDFYNLMGQMTLKMIRSKRLDEDTYNRFDQFFKE